MPGEYGHDEEFESMDFEQLEDHPVYEPILQKKSLEALKSSDSEWFNSEYTGEIDSDGYLINKDGSSSNTKPSQNISGGEIMRKVLEATKDQLRMGL